jgi:hypothetical protein
VFRRDGRVVTPKIDLSQKLETMLISAVRYALGRRTYIVGETVGYIIGLLPRLSDWCVGVMLRDMEDEYAMAERMTSYSVLWDPCDVKEWNKFNAALLAEKERREEGKDK